MGRVIISEFVSLDGVGEDPAGDEGSRLGGWVGEIKGREEVNQVKLDEALGAEALLLGRRSYEFFAARWPSRGGPLADRLNSLPKYVVSSSRLDPDWNNSALLNGDVADAVGKLKRDLDGEIVVYGSIQLARALIELDLVDELRLLVYPVMLGAGERLFGETSDKRWLRLLESRAVGGGVALLSYSRARDA